MYLIFDLIFQYIKGSSTINAVKMTQQIGFTVDAILVSGNPHHRGRPSTAKQLEIERTLRSFFEKSHSATIAARKTGYDIKTVASYYAQFKEDILSLETPDFIQQCQETKQRTLHAYDEHLYSLYEDKAEIEEIIDVAKRLADFKTIEKFYRIKLKIKQNIENNLAAKINLVNSPTAGDIVKLGENKNGN
jgi:hypothetical protein